MPFSQGKYKPSVSSIDELDDRSYKSDEIRKQQIEGSETAPLTTNQHKLNVDASYEGRKKDLEAQNSQQPEDASPETPNSVGPESVNGLRGRLSFDALMNLSRKRRIMYITTACLCAALLVIIILMISFWPEVPFYLKAELCLEKECVESSRQILLWANTSKSACHNTYDWACGNFANEYHENDYYVIKHGEWNFKTFNEYEELNELNRVISMLSTSGTSYSIESMITSLYRSCREIDNLDKTASELLLKKAINSIDSWHAFQNSNRLQVWDYKKALVLLQTMYGVFPYYKVTVDNRFNKPHEYIITLEEGEIGLPDKYFYNIDHNDEIIRGYKLLLRDFAINMKIVSHEADLFADEIFHYEKRIVNNLNNVRSSSEGKVNEVQTLAELKTLAPSLPIFETLQAMFPHIKITEDTEVLVKDVKVLHEMSIIMSTSDKKPIFNFIIWSLARRLMPYLSTEYRSLVENFDHAIYGRIASYPRWMVCSQIVRDWLPFAVDALHQNHMDQKSTQHGKRFYEKPVSLMNKTLGNDQLLELMFYTLRNQLQTSVKEADWIQTDLKEFINEKLTSIRLQIGIPEEALFNKSYINDYYKGLLLGNIFFAEHLESIWSFRKSRMEEKLKTSSIVDTIISEMYTQSDSQPIIYSNILNMVIIKRSVAANKYYDYRYPVSMNFARIGTDILEVLIDSLSTFVEQYNAEQISSNLNMNFPQVDTNCITADEENKEDLKELSEDALKSFHIVLSAAKISAKALTSFINAIDNGRPITGASLNIPQTYENLKLTQRLRIPGLRSYNENELFTITYLQKHCSTFTANRDYAKIKPHVEHQLAEKYLFRATWNHIQFLPRSSSCSVPDVRCSNIL